MIGKYDWFALGWDDIIERDDYEAIRQQTFTIARADSANPGQVHDRIEQELSKYPSPHRDYYMEIRQDANDQYTIAKYFVGAAILNHVLSAFDAAWTVKRHNDRLYEGFAGIQSIELRPSVAINNGEPMPQIQCILKW